MRRVVWLVIILLAIAACGEKRAAVVQSAPVGPTPDSFRVAFETTRGRFVIEARRAWAPKGVDRFYQLVSSSVLDDDAFFRVVPNFVVQFGAPGNPKINAHWDSLRIADDPPVERNLRGTLAFATEGPNTRTSQMFINLADNTFLDRMGFVPFARVVEGMSVVDSIYAGYREKPEYHLIATLGNDYLRRMFPKLDYITTARVIPWEGVRP
jgi:peptidyl-prolyl cis-trans isomerase A (cyclophilin A)